MLAQRLATTEQSVVMSCTKSKSCSASIRLRLSFSWSATLPVAATSSVDRFQPAKTDSCRSDKGKSTVSLNGVPMKSSGSGSDSHGGKILPWSFEPRRSMFFSLVGSWRTTRGSLRRFSTMLTLSPALATFLRRSASEISSLHFCFSLAFSAGILEAPAAFRYSSAAAMAWSRASWPVDREIWASRS